MLQPFARRQPFSVGSSVWRLRFSLPAGLERLRPSKSWISPSPARQSQRCAQQVARSYCLSSDLHPSLRTVHSARWRYYRATATPCTPSCRRQDGQWLTSRCIRPATFRQFSPQHEKCASCGSILTDRFEVTNRFSTPPPPPIHSSTMPEVSRTTAPFSLR